MRVPALRLTGTFLMALAIGPLTLSAQSLSEQPTVESASARRVVDASAFRIGATVIPVRAAPSFAEDGPCVRSQEPQKQRAQQRPRRSRLFGWLYRSVRNVEIEKGAAPPLLFYLRSPLLAGFAEDADCPPEREGEVVEDVCATVIAHSEKDSEQNVDVALPALGATSASDLLGAIRDRLDSGLVVVLAGLDGKSHTLTPGRVRDLEVRSCAPDWDQQDA